MTTFASHNIWMQRCLELAEKGKGNVAPNPMVGCVIVHENKIIGEGFHEKFGGAHAEVNAINSVKDKSLLPESTLFVNLEPCAHFGKTPPCCNLIVENSIKKVVIGALDSNELVAGQGIDFLQKKNVEVLVNVLEKDCLDVNKRFYIFHEKKRPYYLLKWAESLDGFIASNKKCTEISNELSNQRVHQLRAETQAILIGKNTLLIDNPSLSTRLVTGHSPLRIVVVNQLEKAMWNTQIFTDGLPTLVFNTEKSGSENHLEFFQYESRKLIPTLNEVCWAKGIQSVMVEGGTGILQQFLSNNTWDEIIQIIGNKTLGNGIKAPSMGVLSNIKVETVNGDSWNYYVNC